jgi:O-antigen ligase
VVAAAAAGLVVAVAVIALSGSRLGVAMGVVVAGLVLVPRRRALTVAIVVVVALVVGAVAFGPAAGRGAGAHSGVLHGRSDTWRAAVETWSDRPIGGTGADAFLVGSVRHQGGQTIVFAHDLPLELAAELGVAGLILALGLYAATARAVWRARGTTAGRLLGAAALAFPVANLLDWPWHLAGSGAVWALCLGALCAPADAAAVQQS